MLEEHLLIPHLTVDKIANSLLMISVPNNLERQHNSGFMHVSVCALSENSRLRPVKQTVDASLTFGYSPSSV